MTTIFNAGVPVNAVIEEIQIIFHRVISANSTPSTETEGEKKDFFEVNANSLMTGSVNKYKLLGTEPFIGRGALG